MNRKYYVLVGIILFFFYEGSAYPDCDNIIRIEAFKKLDQNERNNVVHPYLHQAFCYADKEEYYINQYLNTFSSPAKLEYRLHELDYLIFRVNLFDDTGRFLDFLDGVLKKIEKSYPDVLDKTQYINAKFTFLFNRYGNRSACSFINEHKRMNLSDLPKNIKTYKYLQKLNKCAVSSGDYTSSVFYLIKALEVAKYLKPPFDRLKKGHAYKVLSKGYYDLKDYERTIAYADSAIYTFLPEFKDKIGLAVSYENKALGVYQLTKDQEMTLELYNKAQQIYKRIDNTSRYHYVERLKAKVYSYSDPKIAAQHLFNYIDYFYKNKRNGHYAKAWLVAHDIMAENNLDYLKDTQGVKISHRQIIDSLSFYLSKERLRKKLKLTAALIDHYSSNLNKDSLIKYNRLKNKLDAKFNDIALRQRSENIDVYLKNYKNEQDLLKLNLVNQEKSFQNRLLTGVIIFVLIGLTFYYFYKRKQKQMMLARLQLEESEHHKLKTEQRLREEKLRRKEQDERLLKLAYDNEIKRKELLQFRLNKKQKEVEAAELEKRSSAQLLDEVFSTLKDGHVNDADQLIKKLQNKHVINKKNKSLKELFKYISPVFIDQLSKMNPKLTEQDVLYCVLIRQKYSTKEIANTLNVSPRSVNQHKYRLKKKLEIPKEIDISTFISKIS